MRIAIDATPLGSRRGGDETYLRNLIAALALVADERDFFPLYLRSGADRPPEVRRHPSFSVRLFPRVPAAIWFGATLPLAAARERERPDLLVSTTHAPIASLVPRAPIVHDLSFRRHPSLYPLRARLRLNALVPLHARQARMVITVSEFSRRDLVEQLGVPPGRVAVIPNAVHVPESIEHAVDERTQDVAGIAAPFFLYLGNLHARKNVARLIDAFVRARAVTPELSGFRLVLAGAPWWGGGGEAAAARRGPPGSIVFLGRVSDERREALLRSAVALAYPSLFEGFGLPPLEAMAAGTPVVASNAGALPEVLGDAALLVPPLDVAAWSQALTRIAIDAGLREHLRTRGSGRARRYSLRRTGDAAIDAFRMACAPHPITAGASGG